MIMARVYILLNIIFYFGGGVIALDQRAAGTGNWCCGITPQSTTEVHVEEVIITKLMFNITFYNQSVPCPHDMTTTQAPTHHHLGILGSLSHSWNQYWNGIPQCTKRVSRKDSYIEYRRQNLTRLVSFPGTCPSEHLKCCTGYELVGGQCVDESSKSALQELIDAGVIG